MEAGEPGTRQSGTPSASNPNPDRFDPRPRDSVGRPYRDGPNMATAALISPSTPYHPHHPPPFSSGYHSGPGASIAGMISPVDSRRTSDDNESSHRQSLPSIQEVIGGPKPAGFQSALPTPMSAAHSLPSPFSTSTPTRPFSDAGGDKHPSPRTLHPSSSFPRPDSLPAFSDPARPPLSGRPPAPPPLSTFSGQRNNSPPMKTEQHSHQHGHPHHPHPREHDPEQRPAEGPPPNGPYSHPPPQAPHQPPQVPYLAPGQLPPGQLPLTAYPISPRHSGPALPSPFEAQRPPIHPDDPEFGRNRNNKYEATLSRHFEAWTYAENLTRIGSCARTLYNFAEAYGTVAREEHGSNPIPARLPTERELAEMMTNVEWARSMLEDVRVAVQQSIINERERQGSRPKGFVEDEDTTMYGDGMKPNYGLNEVKKRRGRAAPPGRCHSCNRIDTPEWRRGPDGARTLCNACGLHYAKLERKRQSGDRSLRPKPSEDRP